MPQRLDIDDRLRLLREIRDTGDLDKIRAAALKSLADASNLVVAEAANLIRQNEIAGTEAALVQTWNRLVESTDPVKADRGCTAKAALIEALGALSYDAPDFYFLALNFRQMEPVWGESVDTAENVRGNAAFALARSQRCPTVDKLVAFVNLLQGCKSDKLNAVRAIADTGSESGIPLLQLRLLSGHAEPEVLGACMSGLLQLALPGSISLVSQFLDATDENLVFEAAAALGQSGHTTAIEVLTTKLKKTRDKELRRSLLLSIGLSRNKAAIEFLIAELDSKSDAAAALEALKPASIFQDTQERIQKTLERIGRAELNKTFQRMIQRQR